MGRAGAASPLVAVALLARARRERRRAPPGARPSGRAILRDRVGPRGDAFFGLQSLSFYAMLTWLPDVLEADAGVTAVAAGALTALAAAARRPDVAGRPAARGAPAEPGRLGGRAPSRRPSALVGLLLAPAAAPLLWALLYGLGTGAAFPLSMTLILLRTRDVAQTGRLSAAAQSAGYLLAATGPIAVGALAEVTGGWTRRAAAAPRRAGGAGADRDRRRPPAPGRRLELIIVAVAAQLGDVGQCTRTMDGVRHGGDDQLERRLA